MLDSMKVSVRHPRRALSVDLRLTGNQNVELGIVVEVKVEYFAGEKSVHNESNYDVGEWMGESLLRPLLSAGLQRFRLGVRGG